MFNKFIEKLPLLAVLRGITPDEILPVAEVLVKAGFLALEVTLNSPDPYESIGRLVKAYGDRVLIGAGTVTQCDQVDRVIAQGGRLIVMPHSDQAVIRYACGQDMICMPGFTTPTEAFTAIAAGAQALKCFPAELISPAALKAMRAVLPKQMPIFPVGGISPDHMLDYYQAGASGFGLGSALYRAGDAPAMVEKKAGLFLAAWQAVKEK